MTGRLKKFYSGYYTRIDAALHYFYHCETMQRESTDIVLHIKDAGSRQRATCLSFRCRKL